MQRSVRGFSTIDEVDTHVAYLTFLLHSKNNWEVEIKKEQKNYREYLLQKSKGTMRYEHDLEYLLDQFSKPLLEQKNFNLFVELHKILIPECIIKCDEFSSGLPPSFIKRRRQDYLLAARECRSGYNQLMDEIVGLNEEAIGDLFDKYLSHYVPCIKFLLEENARNNKQNNKMFLLTETLAIQLSKINALVGEVIRSGDMLSKILLEKSKQKSKEKLHQIGLCEAKIQAAKDKVASLANDFQQVQTERDVCAIASQKAEDELTFYTEQKEKIEKNYQIAARELQEKEANVQTADDESKRKENELADLVKREKDLEEKLSQKVLQKNELDAKLFNHLLLLNPVPITQEDLEYLRSLHNLATSHGLKMEIYGLAERLLIYQYCQSTFPVDAIKVILYYADENAKNNQSKLERFITDSFFEKSIIIKENKNVTFIDEKRWHPNSVLIHINFVNNLNHYRQTRFLPSDFCHLEMTPSHSTEPNNLDASAFKICFDEDYQDTVMKASRLEEVLVSPAQAGTIYFASSYANYTLKIRRSSEVEHHDLTYSKNVISHFVDYFAQQLETSPEVAYADVNELLNLKLSQTEKDHIDPYLFAFLYAVTLRQIDGIVPEWDVMNSLIPYYVERFKKAVGSERSLDLISYYARELTKDCRFLYTTSRQQLQLQNENSALIAKIKEQEEKMAKLQDELEKKETKLAAQQNLKKDNRYPRLFNDEMPQSSGRKEKKSNSFSSHSSKTV